MLKVARNQTHLVWFVLGARFGAKLRERENNIKLYVFSLLINNSLTKQVSYCRKVNFFFFIQNGEVDEGGFKGGGFIAEFLVNIRFG